MAGGKPAVLGYIALSRMSLNCPSVQSFISLLLAGSAAMVFKVGVSTGDPPHLSQNKHELPS